jgi:hypothetical protein
MNVPKINHLIGRLLSSKMGEQTRLGDALSLGGIGSQLFVRGIAGKKRRRRPETMVIPAGDFFATWVARFVPLAHSHRVVGDS